MSEQVAVIETNWANHLGDGMLLSDESDVTLLTVPIKSCI